MRKKNTFLTFLLSAIPGVGHLYLGLMSRGMQLLTAFFGVFFLTFLFRNELFLFAVPLIFFFSLFDALQMAQHINDGQEVEDKPALPWKTLGIKRHWIGYGLIFLGAYLIFYNVLAPIVDQFLYIGWYAISRYVETFFVSILLIFFGLRMIQGNRLPDRQDENQAGERKAGQENASVHEMAKKEREDG
ncbi:MAG: hypothetical protein BAA01_16130 [Bacillus thermozeamaize]|uniref:TM2 domain-containing protein n=1 Tax=Bacillus thermozeamaize TaxID=230954 RepID=A0A1Y3PSS2_9BACI|nr:MAG: hypothetical protein BAA01_16130 [Bacillus thermozeamaize]